MSGTEQRGVCAGGQKAHRAFNQQDFETFFVSFKIRTAWRKYFFDTLSLQAKIFSVLPLHNWTAQGILVLRARVPCRGVYLAAWNGSGMKERKSTWSAKANQVLFTKWRRRWDSNPRAVLPTTRFRDTQSICTLAEHRAA